MLTVNNFKYANCQQLRQMLPTKLITVKAIFCLSERQKALNSLQASTIQALAFQFFPQRLQG
jgi:hypothetical protein